MLCRDKIPLIFSLHTYQLYYTRCIVSRLPDEIVLSQTLICTTIRILEYHSGYFLKGHLLSVLFQAQNLAPLTSSSYADIGNAGSGLFALLSFLEALVGSEDDGRLVVKPLLQASQKKEHSSDSKDSDGHIRFIVLNPGRYLQGNQFRLADPKHQCIL